MSTSCLPARSVLGIAHSISVNGEHGFGLWQAGRVVDLTNPCLSTSFPQVQTAGNREVLITVVLAGRKAHAAPLTVWWRHEPECFLQSASWDLLRTWLPRPPELPPDWLSPRRRQTVVTQDRNKRLSFNTHHIRGLSRFRLRRECE